MRYIRFGIQYKRGNNASKLGIFLWSKLIKQFGSVENFWKTLSHAMKWQFLKI